MKKVLILLFVILNNQVNAQCWKTVKSGDFHTLAIKTDGTLWAWGNNNHGQLGNGTTTNNNTPTKIENSNDWEFIFPGDHSSFAIKSDGSLWAWGFNIYGLLGDGSTVDKSTPTRIGNDFDWKFVSNNSYNTLAQKKNNSIWAWGSNSNGTLGNGSNIDSLIPLQVGAETSWKSISAGSLFSTGIKNDGTIWAWGFGSFGELGNGNLANVNTPTQIGNSNDWTSISASYHTVLAKKNNGTLWGWGLNKYGELGDGTTIQRNFPIQIGNSSDWDNIGIGPGNSFGIKTNGTLWTWGANNAGQLGNGNFNDNYIPSQILFNFSIDDISLGNLSATILTAQKDLYSWGNNEQGQFGNGQFSIQNTNTPLQIINCALDNSTVATNTAPIITASGNQVYCPQTNIKIATSINIVDPDDTSTDEMYIQISTGYVFGQDQLTLTGIHPTIITNWDPTAGKLRLYSPTGVPISYLDFIAAIQDVEFNNPSTSPSGIRKFSISIGQANYLPSTQHYYQYVPNLGITWTAAKTAAEASTYYGLQGYLATILAADEAQLSGKQADGAGWIGGSDAASEGQWKWVTGPEGLANGGTGIIFWNGLANGSTPNFAYWNTSEPNQSGDEDYAHITARGIGISGSWNDLSNTGELSGNYQPKGYIVEYGGMPGDPILQISASTSITIPKITSTTPKSVCGFGSLILQATASDGIVNWFTSSTGGTAVGTGNSYATPIIYTTTSYFVDATSGNCPTATRTEIIATVNTVPTITSTSPSSRCDTGTVTLGATASAGTINWYDVPTGGTSLGTGTSFVSPNITSTTTYYADATEAGCTTAVRTAITATINISPSITSTLPASRCGTGTVMLSAVASAGIINWYDVPTGGILLGTGTSFTTPSLTATTTYYVDATASSCTTTTRTAIIATVYISPSITSTTPASGCDSGTVTLGAVASSGTINWYNVPTGGISLGTGTYFTTPTLTSTTNYYADATASGCTTPTRTSITASINTSPTITSTIPNSRCDSGAVTLGAGASAGTINWYNVQTGGTSLGTGSSFTTPSISSTTTYYVDANASGCTTSTRTAIAATINSSPSITSTSAASRCDVGSVILGAVASSGTINWYDVLNGGTSLGTGNSFTTPSISTTTTYYVETVGALCTTPTRTAIIATINAIPSITSNTPASRCDAGTVTLGAVASAGNINWYNVPTGGILLGTGTSFTTPSIVSTTTFYVDATATGCTTTTRTAITATVNTSPSITSTTPASRCDTGSVTLGAVASSGTINWYDVPTGGISLGNGNSFTTPSISTTATYYVDTTTQCTSPRVAVVATIYPVVNINEEIVLCQTATLDASISGMNYLWSPGGETTQTIVVSSIGDYSVIISSPFIVCDSNKYIKVIEHPAPIINAIMVSENSMTIELSNPASFYEFSIDGEIFQNSNQFSYIPSGQHTAFVREKNFCNLTQQDFTIFTIAKYFTPNNDGFNDVWEIKEMKDFPSSSALIFDRYGKLITTLSALKYSWDGKYNNNILPADDYWYRLKMEDSKPEVKGHFSLKR